MKITVVSTLQHSYTIYIPTTVYAKELLIAQEDSTYKITQSPSYDIVSIPPGISSLEQTILLRLQNTRVFVGLLAGGSIKINDVSAEDMYQAKLDPHFRSTKEYQAAKKQAELEATNARLHGECAVLKENINVLQLQMAELLNVVKSKKAKKEGGFNDNPSDNKDPIS